MIHARGRHSLVIAAMLFVGAAPALAHPGWGDAGWGRPDFPEYSDWSRQSGNEAEARIGKVQVSRFAAEGDAAGALGHGAVTVAAMAGSLTDADGRELATYEAALVDQLAKAGYDTAVAAPQGGQLAELCVTHDVVVPEEAPHKPVSGEMSMGVSNRGSMMGMAIAVDLSKPRKALISTRLEARIRDRASNQVLWEGRADIITREGDSRWSDSRIAGRLAEALFDDFPKPGEKNLALR